MARSSQRKADAGLQHFFENEDESDGEDEDEDDRSEWETRRTTRLYRDGPKKTYFAKPRRKGYNRAGGKFKVNPQVSLGG